MKFEALAVIGRGGVGCSLSAAWSSATEREFERWLAAVARRRRLSVLLCFTTVMVVRAALLPVMPAPAAGVSGRFQLSCSRPIPSPTGDSRIHPIRCGLISRLSTSFFSRRMLRCIRRLRDCYYCRARCWSSVCGRVVQPWTHVCGDLLDAARLDATRMGAARRPAARAPVGIFSYWANSYCGGAVAAIGGALVLGAWPRIVRAAPARCAVLGLGLAILANSRPYEGFILACQCCVAFSVDAGKRRPPHEVILPRVVLPVFLLLTMTGGAMGYYFRELQVVRSACHIR